MIDSLKRQLLIRARAVRNVLLGRPVAYRVNVWVTNDDLACLINVGNGYAAECAMVRHG